ncbi:hypothetical protein WDW86_01075 [Bdellovibrionota bacterium FG-2]
MSAEKENTTRYKSFHHRCRGMCSSRKQFLACFEIDQSHILHQGLAKNRKRLALIDEDLASVILGGALLESRCEAKQSAVQIVIEGCFKNFSWVDYTGRGETQAKVEPIAQVRVVIRERKPRHLIVTAYILDPPEKRIIPEVNREVWK